MTWGIKDIKLAFDEGVAQGASHMLVACDSFDNENYPIYVMPGENPRDKVPTNGDRVDECYRMSNGWFKQSIEKRANNWEYDEAPVEKKILSTADLSVKATLSFTSGVVLPYTLPAREGPIMPREEKSGTVFVSLEELEDLHSTEPFVSFVLFSSEAGQAVEDAGWATAQTRGGHVATEEFRKSNIMSELFAKATPLWNAQTPFKDLGSMGVDELDELSRLLTNKAGA